MKKRLYLISGFIILGVIIIFTIDKLSDDNISDENKSSFFVWSTGCLLYTSLGMLIQVDIVMLHCLMAIK